MSVCGLNLATDIGNIWLRTQGDVRKRLFINLFAAGISESLRDGFEAEVGHRAKLREATRAFESEPSEQAWKGLVRWQKELNFHFSFLDHIDQLPREFFEDPQDSAEAIYFGDCILRHQWSLPDVFNPVRRLMRLGGIEPGATGPYHYDPETGQVERPEALIRDYQVVRAWVSHLLSELRVPSDEPLRGVLAFPTASTALARAIFSQLLREAGFEAVVLRPQSEVLARHAPGSEAAIIINISTLATEVIHELPGDGTQAVELSFDDVGDLMDRDIERRIRERIRAEEGEDADDLEFDEISARKLFFWKDAYRSSLWSNIASSAEYFGEFQYPYRVGGAKTLRDVRPLLDADLLRAAMAEVLREPLTRAFKEILARREAAGATGPLPPILLCGSGSRTEGAQEIIEAIAAEASGQEPASITVECVAEPLDAIVSGALGYGESLPEEAWQRVIELQSDWNEIPIKDGRLEEWFARWSELMDDAAHRDALHCNLPWRDR